MIAAGEIVTIDGPLDPSARFVAGDRVWFHRDLPEESPVPFEIGIVHRDDDLLIVDKPHFMATIPRGRHVLQTALIRLRTELDLPELVPAHRLDRSTAGLVLFIINPEVRGAYQLLFQNRRVKKVYEALAPYRPDLELPRVVRSRIVKEHGVLTAYEIDGEPNSETLVELVEHTDGIGRYRLTPKTGKTHQLRLHLHGLGIPIVGDDFYPAVLDRPLDHFTDPLQLLAAELQFDDPITGQCRQFHTRRVLAGISQP